MYTVHVIRVFVCVYLFVCVCVFVCLFVCVCCSSCLLRMLTTCAVLSQQVAFKIALLDLLRQKCVCVCAYLCVCVNVCVCTDTNGAEESVLYRECKSGPWGGKRCPF